MRLTKPKYLSSKTEDGSPRVKKRSHSQLTIPNYLTREKGSSLMQFNKKLLTCRTKKNIDNDQTQQSFLTQRVKRKNLASLNTLTAAGTIDFNNMLNSNNNQSNKQLNKMQRRPAPNKRGSSLHILGRKCPSDYGYSLTPVMSKTRIQKSEERFVPQTPD